MMSLVADQIEVGYGRLPVLDGVSLELAPGQITGIVGPNGCGKSTLLKALAGRLPCRSGEVLLDHQPLPFWRPRELARCMARLPQSPAAAPGLTVRELVALGRHPHIPWPRVAAAADHAIVREALAHCGLLDLAERPVTTLSGGERQRAWIAMTIAQAAPILLLDEPIAALDVNHQLELMELLSRLQRDRQLTIVMVLHDLNLTLRYCHRIVAMRQGVILCDKPVATIDPSRLVPVIFGVQATPIAVEGRAQPLLDFSLLHHTSTHKGPTP